MDTTLENLKTEAVVLQTVLSRARAERVDQTRIDKLVKKLESVNTRIQNLENTVADTDDESDTENTHEQRVEQLKQQIETLEAERVALDNKIHALECELYQLQPYQETFSNDPRQIDAEAEAAEIEEQEELAAHIAERRRICQEMGGYNSSAGCRVVKIDSSDTVKWRPDF